MAAPKAVFDEVEQRLAGTYKGNPRNYDNVAGLREMRRYLARQASLEQPCWACGRPSSQLHAGNNSYQLGHGNTDGGRFVCPWCTAPMEHSVPFVGVDGKGWYWSRPAGVVVTGWAEVANSEVERG
jgi:hypothetical protein